MAGVKFRFGFIERLSVSFQRVVERALRKMEAAYENVRVKPICNIYDALVRASADPIAIDQACVDLVYASSDPGRPHLIERIESRNGIHTIEAAAELGFGSREYELIEI